MISKTIPVLIFFICVNIFSQTVNHKYSNKFAEKIGTLPGNQSMLVWVYFNNKGKNLERYFLSPNTVVSERSLKRRAKVLPKNKRIDFTDIPVNSNYVKKLKKLGIKIKHKSKWLNAVSCYITKSVLQRLEKLPVVKKITEVKKYKKRKVPQPVEKQKTGQISSLTSTAAHTYNYGSSITQNEVINTVAVHDQGYSGKGILICLMDAGFDHLNHDALKNINIIAAWDFVNNDPDVQNGTDQGEGSHGTSTLSLIGGFKEGQIIGTAFGADYLLAKTENTTSETPVEEDNWVAASEWADSIGADVFSTSLGYLTFDTGYTSYTYQDMDGNTAAITIAADLAVKKGIVVFNSAGNNGNNSSHNTLNAPADGDSVVAIGAVNSGKIRASFSSVGPTFDGRIKPDLMAMGDGTYAASNSSNTSYRSFSGTSASCPLAAGVPALMLEKDYSLTPIQIRTILRNTADHSAAPDNLYGWGTIDALAAMNQIPSVLVQVKIYLEGAYNASLGEMNTDLNSNIPLTSPYPENKRTISSMPAGIVDWVLVELRTTPNDTAVASRSALLRKDGSIVADDGLTTEIKLDAMSGNYYIIVKNRNHLTIMSANKIALNTSTSTLYDFTTGSDKFYGTGGAKQLN